MPPRFGDYQPRKKPGEGPTPEELARDCFRRAWPAYVLTGVLAVLIVALGVIVGGVSVDGVLGTFAGLGAAALYVWWRWKVSQYTSGEQDEADEPD